MIKTPQFFFSLFLISLSSACLSPTPEGLHPIKPADVTVKMDFEHRPLPDIPLPNDIATRFDATSPTQRRLNVSMVAPTYMEQEVRTLLDTMDGWGVFQPIVIPFTGTLDIQSILDAHRDPNYGLEDDVLYLVNIDRKSNEYGRIHHLNVGNGNYPVVLERKDKYWGGDPRRDSTSLIFDDEMEDSNNNGILDEGEDTDADGVLDMGNYLPGTNPTTLQERADALMTFYERETNTLIVKPLVPLRERTRYAVVVTKRLKDEKGNSVGSPYPYINHLSQTEDLRPLLDKLPNGLTVDDIAYAFSFTTQTIEADWKALRDGLYEKGVQKQLGKDFPAKIDRLYPLRDASYFPNVKKHYLLYGEQWRDGLSGIAGDPAILDMDSDTQAYEDLVTSQSYIDYMVIGSYTSPQLFKRKDKDGKNLRLHEQVWPSDLENIPLPNGSQNSADSVHGETVYFTLTIPRKENSVRGEGKPAPLLIMGHGYTSNRFELVSYAGFLAKHGVASIAIDGPSHGISINALTTELVKGILGNYGLSATATALLEDRAFDQNDDGIKDSGADFWTSYLFHTRDIVRQFALDYMQLIRIFRTFDGTQTWGDNILGPDDPNDSILPSNGLAGDFDGDGVVDVGGDTTIGMTGGSLGGMMSMVVGAVEPHMDAIVPIAGGGGLSDIGIRSFQGGVVEAFILRGMGPLYIGTLDTETGLTKIETVVPDLNSTGKRTLAQVEGIGIGDTVIVENMVTGERGCGYVGEDGSFRAAVASDYGDETEISFYRGIQLVLGNTECRPKDGAEAYRKVDTFEEDITYQGQEFTSGMRLESLEEGLGLRRTSPALRRFQGLGQLVLDPADPAVLAPHLLNEPLEYEGTGEKTGTHTVVLTTTGDMNVPASSGVTHARAAGLVEYLKDDPRYGKPLNQVLLDTHMAEAVHTLGRYTDGNGNSVHLDVENFSGGNDKWGPDYPRLDPPLRIGMDKIDPLGGYSAAIFPLTNATGQHGFDPPGAFTDDAIKKCKSECPEIDEEETTSCEDACENTQTYDVGRFLFNMIGKYLASGGMTLSTDACLSTNDCTDFPTPPADREADFLTNN